MKRVIIIGAGDLGRQYSHWIDHYSEDKVVGWLDDTKVMGSRLHDHEVLGPVSKVEEIRTQFDSVAVAIGYKNLSFKNKLLHQLMGQGIALYSFIHPSAFVDVSAHIGAGVFVYPHCVVDQRVVLEDGVRLGNNVVISHDSHIGRCCYFAPSVTTSGSVHLGACCFVGTGTVFKNSVRIVSHSVLGAGALILKSIAEPGTYVGGPHLRKLK